MLPQHTSAVFTSFQLIGDYKCRSCRHVFNVSKWQIPNMSFFSFGV